jgi:hypothetical protein
MDEIVFEVTQEADGGYCARAVGEGIFTQGDDLDDLRFMVRDATLAYFDEGKAPKTVRLNFLTVTSAESLPLDQAA